MKKNDTIHIIGYPENRLSSHPSINHLSGIYPTLGGEIENILRNKGIQNDKDFCISDFSKTNRFDLINFKNEKKSLLEILDKLSEILGDKKPIIFLSDGCFTNDLFVREMGEILEDDYNKYIEEVEISYEDISKNHHIPNYLYENSILILGGSLVNLDSVPKEFYNGELVNFIKDVHNNKINSKLIGICWGHQLISHIIGLDEILSEKIVTTYIGEAQFGTMPSKLSTSINNIPFAYKGVINAITNNGEKQTILSVLTRIGHTDLDFLSSYRLQSQSLFPLLVDPITNSSRICGSRNSQYLGIQDHYEVNPKIDTEILYNNTYKLLENLESIYGQKVKKILLNIERQSNFENNLGKPLFTSILLSFGNSIVAKDIYCKKNLNNNFDISGKEISQKELKGIISKENFGGEIISDKDFFQKLDNYGLLRLVSYLDWSISRGSIEVSNILGFDLIKLINEHKEFLKNSGMNKGIYTFRDLGAGRGKLINDVETGVKIINKLDKKDENNTIVYGVSDYAYFNIYELLVSLDDFKNIPRNVLKVFVEELINNYKKLNTGNEKDKIIESLKCINLNTKSFKICSMFSESTTYRYNCEEEELTKEDKKFIIHHENIINNLKIYIENNLYNLIKGNYDKIIFSDFNSLYIDNKNIKRIDFQTAIRATSHLDSKKIQAMSKDYIDHFAKPGSIFVDNGIIRSDSGVPRIKEYIDLEKDNNDVKVTFIYDIKTSYITSAIINKAPYIGEEKIKSCLQDGYIILSIDEIEKGSFFKIERFFRELIIFTFKNLQFTHEKNKYIMDSLKEISSEMSNKTSEYIINIIIEKINNLISIVNKDYNKNYTEISLDIFEKYLENVDDDIIDFFNKGNVNIPQWFNQNFERNN